MSIAMLLAVPVLMGDQNWDDHDRSGAIQHNPFLSLI